MELKIPTHVGIIMDGNGRWAKERGKNRSEGHLAGSINLEKLAQHIYDRGVKVLSVFAFSTENFKRSKEEVDYLMNLFIKMFKRNLNTLKKRKIRIVFSKKESGLPEKLEKIISDLEQETKDYTNGIFNICINYGGQDEIIDMTKKICNKVLNGELKIDDINREVVEANLYQELPPIDYLIRTSGEYRISNYMLWQLAYAEMYFTNTYFPDFDNTAFDIALEEYTRRDRRFGTVKV